jgi:hypothetical protein
MDRREAQRLLSELLADYRKLTYVELVSRIGNDERFQVSRPSNIEYQVEIQFMWDGRKGGDIRVLAAIDDGSLRGAFWPVCEDFIVTPDENSF